MMEMIAAAKAKPAESPNCLQNEELQRQVAMLMSGGGGCVPMAVVNDDDEDWVGSDLSGSSVGSVSSTTHWISTGQVNMFIVKAGFAFASVMTMELLSNTGLGEGENKFSC